MAVTYKGTVADSPIRQFARSVHCLPPHAQHPQIDQLHPAVPGAIGRPRGPGRCRASARRGSRAGRSSPPRPRSGIIAPRDARLVQQRGGAVDAEAPLARPHAEANRAAQIVQAGRPGVDRRMQPVARDQLALAEEFAVALLLFHARQWLPQPEESRLTRQVRQGRTCVARPVPGGCGRVRSTPSRAAARSTVRSAISRKVVNLPPTIEMKPSTPSRSRWSSSLKSRLRSRLSDTSGILIERAHPGPGAQCAGPGEPRHQLVPLIQHEGDLVGRHRRVVGVGHRLVGRADHADGADRHQDVAIGGRLAAVDDAC